ncbi:hypothetical protein SAMN04488030_0216 [Aliiroseovarius halocynthiae]|nr:hypothetical protein SAMN04488030_0216 [Aliiroseovarius halocynthiae]
MRLLREARLKAEEAKDKQRLDSLSFDMFLGQGLFDDQRSALSEPVVQSLRIL